MAQVLTLKIHANQPGLYNPFLALSLKILLLKSNNAIRTLPATVNSPFPS